MRKTEAERIGRHEAINIKSGGCRERSLGGKNAEGKREDAGTGGREGRNSGTIRVISSGSITAPAAFHKSRGESAFAKRPESFLLFPARLPLLPSRTQPASGSLLPLWPGKNRSDARLVVARRQNRKERGTHFLFFCSPRAVACLLPSTSLD